jgi:triacylglycerol lipase
VWNQLETMQGFDHFAVIGWGANSSKSLKMYDKLMAILSALD